MRDGLIPFLHLEGTPAKPLVVHRLDEATSGIMVFAKTLPVQRALGISWERGRVKKVYEAEVDARAIICLPPQAIEVPISELANSNEGVVLTPLQPSSHLPLLSRGSSDSTELAGIFRLSLQQSLLTIGGGIDASLSAIESLAVRLARVFASRCSSGFDTSAKEAITRWRVLHRFSDGRIRLQLEPVTGRTHQLRLHCALPPPFGLGAPILGDHFYSDSFCNELDTVPPSAGATLSRSFFPEIVRRSLEIDSNAGSNAPLTTGHLLLAGHLLRQGALRGVFGPPTSSRLHLHARELHLPDDFDLALSACRRLEDKDCEHRLLHDLESKTERFKRLLQRSGANEARSIEPRPPTETDGTLFFSKESEEWRKALSIARKKWPVEETKGEWKSDCLRRSETAFPLRREDEKGKGTGLIAFFDPLRNGLFE